MMSAGNPERICFFFHYFCERKKIDFVVPGLPAGTYSLYFGSIYIYSVDCGVAAYNLPAAPTPVTSLYFTRDGMTISEYTGEAIIDNLTVQVRNGDTGEDVTNDAVWESSNPEVASVSYGVVALRSAGTAVISARIDNVIKPLHVTVTPCTKTIVTFIDKANLPEEKEIIDLDNPSENLIAALTPTIVTSTTFSFVSDTMRNATFTIPGTVGEYANGWYMPTLAELCGIYRNNDTLNAVLDALGLTHLHSSYYWSSSQSANKNYDAWAVDFSSGTVSYRDKVYNGKYNDFYVCCVRAFN